MKTIHRICKRLEEEHEIRILFAVENGSRAWGLSSADSDYDVRYAYARPVRDYLRVNPMPDVIESYYDKEGVKKTRKGLHN